ncbi:hypothetical protein CB0940_04669 [Cercospora beticola]|uniref:Uncharacterized protein n=1 Tax=Cercospora beticola TaxID=122368 RepID=A0A2G5HLX5_CERBT|nr:hypothetical protein CB0940_04669 [Cercospora beticola]PIA93564.1 hypothetical protein CB0940_04669 [Cercospora beticola]WPB01929.1 hypothetical protein RHO25_006562 [Cercospora beticola]CAK1363225.1 unnamed protein product [Cercospora beticola]
MADGSDDTRQQPRSRLRKNEKSRASKARNKFKKSLPQITEDNLLHFQLMHFGDDTKPNEWFVDAQKALNFELEYEEPDDELGYYDDGVKRTLTDEQIAVFRRTELWQMKRAQELQQQEEREAKAAIAEQDGRAASPVSDVSSLEDELLAFATAQRKDSRPALAPPSPKQRQHSQSGRSEATSSSTGSRKRKRTRDVPYDQRHKRKWEGYINNKDPIEGSVTHRRLAREMDDQQNETIEMDY